jgi:small subunit ribosomal protein S2
MVDTNSDPTTVDFPIPANDDASKSISLIVDLMCKAIEEGLGERKVEKEKDGEVKEKPVRREGRSTARKVRSVKFENTEGREEEVVTLEKGDQEKEDQEDQD